MNEQLTKIAEVLADSEANGSGIYRKRSAYSRRVAYLSVVEFGGDAELKAAAKLFKAAPKLLEVARLVLSATQNRSDGDYQLMHIDLSEAAEIARAAIREATE